jgi:hypothetical protein
MPSVEILFESRFYWLDCGVVVLRTPDEAVRMRLPFSAVTSHEAAFVIESSGRQGMMRMAPVTKMFGNGVRPSSDAAVFKELDCISSLGDESRPILVGAMLSLAVFSPWIRDD